MIADMREIGMNTRGAAMNWLIGTNLQRTDVKGCPGRFPIGRSSGRLTCRSSASYKGWIFCKDFDEELWTLLLEYATICTKDCKTFSN